MLSPTYNRHYTGASALIRLTSTNNISRGGTKNKRHTDSSDSGSFNPTPKNNNGRNIKKTKSGNIKKSLSPFQQREDDILSDEVAEPTDRQLLALNES